VFDLDGVLVDSSPCHARAYAAVWERIGIAGPPYHEIAGRTTLDVVTEATSGLTPSEAAVSSWVRFKQERARSYIATEARLFDDTLPALRLLGDRGVTLALGTSASRGNAMLTLERFDLTSHFHVIVTGDDVARGKPQPDIYTKTIRDAGCQGAEVLVVEDSGAGVAAGLAADAWVAVVRSSLEVPHERFFGSFSNVGALVEHFS
jgi:beta-phosphoglucomutase